MCVVTLFFISDPIKRMQNLPQFLSVNTFHLRETQQNKFLKRVMSMLWLPANTCKCNIRKIHEY